MDKIKDQFFIDLSDSGTWLLKNGENRYHIGKNKEAVLSILGRLNKLPSVEDGKEALNIAREYAVEVVKNIVLHLQESVSDSMLDKLRVEIEILEKWKESEKNKRVETANSQIYIVTPDYAILSFRSKKDHNVFWEIGEDDFYHNGAHRFSLSAFMSSLDLFEIWKVRRNSDLQEFSVGDVIKDGKYTIEICSFYIQSDNTLIVETLAKLRQLQNLKLAIDEDEKLEQVSTTPMTLVDYRVQYETQEKKAGQDNGSLTIATFQAYNELDLQQVMRTQLGYAPPVYYIIEPKIETQKTFE